MLQRVSEYINNQEFRLTLLRGRIHVLNYQKILSLEDERISFSTPIGRLVLKGEKLSLVKLLDQELLISGKIHTIEVLNEE